MSGLLDQDQAECSEILSTSILAKDICFKVFDRRRRSCFDLRFDSIFAHKKVLAAASPVFKAQFYPENSSNSESDKLKCIFKKCIFKEGSDVLDIKNTSSEAFKLMIEFVYGSEIEWGITSPECIFDIYLLASKYRIQNLVEVSEKEVRNFTRSDVIEIYGAMNIAKMIIDPLPPLDQVIFACADSMFSKVRSVNELQSLARSVTSDPVDCQAFCYLLACKRNLELESSEKVDSGSLRLDSTLNSGSLRLDSTLNQMECAEQLVASSYVSTFPPNYKFSSPTLLLPAQCSQSFVFPPTGKLFSFLKNPVTGAISDHSVIHPYFQFSSPILPSSSASSVIADVGNKNFKFNFVAPLPSFPLANNDQSLNNLNTTRSAELEPGSPNLLDDLQLYSAECSQTTLFPSSRSFSCIKSPHNGFTDVLNNNILKPPGKANIFDGSTDGKRGTVRCKPFELLRKEDIWLEKGEIQIAGIAPKSKAKDKCVEIVEIEDSPVRNQKIDVIMGRGKQLPVVKKVITEMYVCGTSYCFTQMTSLKNWRRHMKKVHKIPNAISNEALVVNKNLEANEEIDAFDFDLPLGISRHLTTDTNLHGTNQKPKTVKEIASLIGKRKLPSSELERGGKLAFNPSTCEWIQW